jgi:hypothetical protein
LTFWPAMLLEFARLASRAAGAMLEARKVS